MTDLLVPSEDRFERQTALPGWSQTIVSSAKVLVVGTGAVGNETLKNLALLGVRKLGVIDHDLIESSNLARSVLFRARDVGQSKAHAAGASVTDIYPEAQVRVHVLDVVTELGAGLIAQYDLVLGCLDNIEARWKLNRLCQCAQVAWIDAGIDGTSGQISYFSSSAGACYECSMTASMWERMLDRRSCLVGLSTSRERPVPASVVLASLVSSLQVQEALVQLHQSSKQNAPSCAGLSGGSRVCVDVSPYSLSVMTGKRNAECAAHVEIPDRIENVTVPRRHTTAREILERTGSTLIEFDWDVATSLHCSRCGPEAALLPSWRLRQADLVCPRCRQLRRPSWENTLSIQSPLLNSFLPEFGIPAFAYVNLRTREGRKVQARLSEPVSGSIDHDGRNNNDHCQSV